MWPTIFILVLLIPILAIVLDSPVGRALAGRLERKGLGEAPDMMAERMAFLEGELERLKLEDESQFMQELLADRQPSEALPPVDRTD